MSERWCFLYIFVCVCLTYAITVLYVFVSEVVGERRGQRAGLPTHGVSDATAMNWERLRW
jgi:hypothetical protein